jgi:hypothetical protein
VLFYEQLIRISSTLGTRTGHAAAVGEANGPEAWLAALDKIDPNDVSGDQPYWAVRARLLQPSRKHLRLRIHSTGQLVWQGTRPWDSSYFKTRLIFSSFAQSKSDPLYSSSL